MRKAYAWLMYLLRIGGSLFVVLSASYYFLKAELIELWHTLQYLTLSDIAQALFAGMVVGSVVYLLGKVRGWPHRNTYYWLVPWVKSLMKPIHRERLEIIETALTKDVEDKENDGEYPPVITTKLDHWAYHIDRWSQHAIGFVGCMVCSIGANSMLHNEHSSVWDLLIRLLAVLLVVSLLPIPLRYLAGVGLLIIWLDYTAITNGEPRSAVQAVLIGVGLVFLSIWERWQGKIRQAPPEQP
jgi:hypothetical protein